MSDATIVFYERLIALASVSVLAILTSLLAWRLGFYRLPHQTHHKVSLINWTDVLGGFVVLLTAELVSAPLFYYLWIFVTEGRVADLGHLKLNIQQQSWLNVFAILITGLAFLFYFRMQGKEGMAAIWGRSKKNGQIFFDFFIGAVAWLVAYPLVGVLGQLIALILSFFYSGSHSDQIAVKHLKDIMHTPWLFSITVIEIITIIPFLEELLFRGFLQTWLKQKYGIGKAVVMTSLIFAFFHFSFSQGIDNIELLSSLFVLSCFLGFVRERQQSLWASIGLHSTFNGISILLLTSDFLRNS